jgi:hypothetical protein
MFLLVLIIATANLALGYALAIWLGWGSLPDFGKKPASSEPASPPHSNQ